MWGQLVPGGRGTPDSKKPKESQSVSYDGVWISSKCGVEKGTLHYIAKHDINVKGPFIYFVIQVGCRGGSKSMTNGGGV